MFAVGQTRTSSGLESHLPTMIKICTPETEVIQQAVEQNTLIDPDDAVNPLSEDLVQGLDDGGNREVVDSDVGEPIDDDSNDMLEVLEGSE